MAPAKIPAKISEIILDMFPALERFITPKYVRQLSRSEPYQRAVATLLSYGLLESKKIECIHDDRVECRYIYLSEAGCEILRSQGIEPEVCGEKEFDRWYVSHAMRDKQG